MSVRGDASPERGISSVIKNYFSKLTHDDVRENTCKRGELKVYFLFCPIRRRMKKKNTTQHNTNNTKDRYIGMSQTQESARE